MLPFRLHTRAISMSLLVCWSEGYEMLDIGDSEDDVRFEVSDKWSCIVAGRLGSPYFVRSTKKGSTGLPAPAPALPIGKH